MGDLSPFTLPMDNKLSIDNNSPNVISTLSIDIIDKYSTK